MGFLFTMETILSSYPTGVLCGRPGLFALLSSPVHLFFLRMYKAVDITLPNIIAFLKCFFLFSQFKDFLFHLHGELLSPHVVCSQQNHPNSSTTTQISSRLLSAELIKTQQRICPHLNMKQPLSHCPVTFGPFKKRVARVKELQLLTPSSSLNLETLKWKLRVCTSRPCAFSNYNWNMFQQTGKNPNLCQSKYKHIWA